MSKGILLSKEHSFLKSIADMDDLISPLKRLGLIFITFMRNFNDGREIYLSNIPGWTEDYYSLGLYQQFISKKPQDYALGHLIWPKDKPLMVFDLAKERYNSDHGLTLVKPRKDYTDFYFLSTTVDNPNIINFYLNYPDVLERFVTYFEDRARSLITKNEKHAIKLSRNNSLEDNIIKDIYNITSNDIEKSIREMRIRNYFMKNKPYHGIKLAGQEIQCILNYFHDHLTADETASRMNIRKKTVERYFENVRDKLSCNSKDDILRILAEDGFDLLKILCKR